MLHEHELGRAHARAMADNLDAAADGHAAAVDAVIRHGVGYAELLEGHIRKENGILFEMADRILPAEEQTRLERVYQTAIPDWNRRRTAVPASRRWPRHCASAGRSTPMRSCGRRKAAAAAAALDLGCFRCLHRGGL